MFLFFAGLLFVLFYPLPVMGIASFGERQSYGEREEEDREKEQPREARPRNIGLAACFSREYDEWEVGSGVSDALPTLSGGVGC